MEESRIFKLTLNYILLEENEATEKLSEYETQIAKSILNQKPENMVEYKLAEQRAKIEHQEMLTEIRKKQNFANNLKLAVNHIDLMADEYKEFEKQTDELFELLNKILGDD